MQRYTRSIAELWQHWQPNAKAALHPMVFTAYEDHQRVFAKLTSLDHDAWAAAYSAAAAPFEALAREAEAKGDERAAKEHYFHAYGLYRMARFPTTNSEGKRAAYRKSQEMYRAALRYLPHAFERVDIPFKGRLGEGDRAIGYFVRRRGDDTRRPLLIMWAGIDTFKEDRTEIWEPVIAAGLSLLLIDMPGVGDAPLKGSEDAERLWDAVLDWCATRPEIDPHRIGAWEAAPAATGRRRSLTPIAIASLPSSRKAAARITLSRLRGSRRRSTAATPSSLPRRSPARSGEAPSRNGSIIVRGCRY